MMAEINEPKSTKVLGFPAAPSWTPRPSDLPPWNRDTIGLMMSVVKAVIRPLKAKAMTSPTATTITSPRIRKFLKPFMPFVFPSGEGALWGYRARLQRGDQVRRTIPVIMTGRKCFRRFALPGHGDGARAWAVRDGS